MNLNKSIVLAVTNDIVYDQRMQRICTTLHNAGYIVNLIGRKHSASKPLQSHPYSQTRFTCWLTKGKLFYLEYNIKLFIHLLFSKKADAYCAIDLDTIVPIYYISKIKNKKRVYDAHELFCEMEEVASRPKIHRVWKWIEKKYVPHYKNGYTIGQLYANEFNKMYGVTYAVVRNATVLRRTEVTQHTNPSYILYQGAVNEGRGFETLIPAMQFVNAKLIICGSGPAMEKVKNLIAQHNLDNKIELKGYIQPNELINYTRNAYIGITLFSTTSKSNYLSLANRFFDYMHAGVPQIAMEYPEYSLINNEFEIAILLQNLESNTIANALNNLLNNTTLYKKLQANTIECRKKYCWQQQEITLLQFYKNLFEQ